MKLYRQIYWLVFHLIIGFVFVFGGFLQFTLGFSNTIITFAIVCILFAVYLLYVLLNQKIILSKITLLSLVYALFIVITGLIRQSHIVSIIAYLIFPLLPLAVYCFYYINSKEVIIKEEYIFKLFYYIALIQLPILLIQKNFYDALIPFNNSGQIIEWFDFMFGTFFIKSDHSLGFFLLAIIAVILVKNENFKKPIKFKVFAIIYLSLTLLLTESNISKLFLFLLLAVTTIIPLYKKYGKSLKFKLAAIFLLFALALFGYSQKDQQYVKNKLGGDFRKQFSLPAAEKFYELGTAKRFQIIIVATKKLDTKWLGDGPYSYFDIRTGEFKQTRHFTQLIWSYYDLGVLGLLLVVWFLFAILGYLETGTGWPFVFFTMIFFAYSFYTTIFSDIAIFLTMFGCFNKKQALITGN